MVKLFRQVFTAALKVESSGRTVCGTPRIILLILGLSYVLAACLPVSEPFLRSPDETPFAAFDNEFEPTPLPTRPVYSPGELVEYFAQSGDTLPALVKRFNTTEKEIREANPILPNELTTLPPGLPMQVPIYYQPLWGSAYQMLPDSHFVNGPTVIGFDPVLFVDQQPGWLKDYQHHAGGRLRRGGELVEYVATNYSINPRLLLAILEYQTGCLTQSSPNDPGEKYPLGHVSLSHRGLYRQLVWAANTLNNGYYGWRTGRMTVFEHQDGRLERPDPWQNAATVGIQNYFAKVVSEEKYYHATHSQGLPRTYTELFGDSWSGDQALYPGSIKQPELTLPFTPGKLWAFTGGPHTGWGVGDPLAALDFAPPAVAGGCTTTLEWATAVADGVIVRTDTGTAILDLDGDGEERTGWVVYYLHLETTSIPPKGTRLSVGEPIGKPSCDGGSSTGTHIHIARKYNGEWIPADGALAFNLEGWIGRNGRAEYEGSLERFGRRVRACICSDAASQIRATQTTGP
ncbi:MAG: hypothetical protein U1B80_01595 [Anaerolineaceae bacterium]|nr:hypothetical protein [Anaerolineaceae bacterium]